MAETDEKPRGINSVDDAVEQAARHLGWLSEALGEATSDAESKHIQQAMKNCRAVIDLAASDQRARLDARFAALKDGFGKLNDAMEADMARKRDASKKLSEVAGLLEGANEALGGLADLTG